MEHISEDTRGPSLGEPAPFFQAAVGNNSVMRNNAKGKWILFFSHPDDLLPVFQTKTINYILCKRKTKVFSLGNGQLLDIAVGKNFLKKYMNKHCLTIIDDSDREIARSYGLTDGNGNFLEHLKGVFVIDPRGILRIKLYFPLSAERNFYEILKLVDALQASDSHRKLANDSGLWKRSLGIVIKPRPAAEEG